MKNSVLVTGAAGYIGSHTLRNLQEKGYLVVAVDDLSLGRRDFVPPGVPFYQADCGDKTMMTQIISNHGVGAVVHFAGSIDVEESISKPGLYYRNNSVGTLRLASAAATAGVKRFVFSSTCAVYGNPAFNPVDEMAQTCPTSPYGMSKLFAEHILRDLSATSGMSAICLRYFNVAGAHPDQSIGQVSRGGASLIKACAEAAVGIRPAVQINGTDYQTHDGTCVRDFIHVCDLAELHALALSHLGEGLSSEIINCGYGRGFSVRQVINAMKEVSGVAFDVIEGPRRPGDIEQIFADISKLNELFEWTPRYADLREICRSALKWEMHLA